MTTSKLKNAFGVMIISMALTSVTAAASPDDQFGIRTFVRTVHVEGIYYQDVAKFDTRSVPVLLKMLDDPQEEEHRSNIIVALSMIGGAEVTDAIIDFIEASDGKTPTWNEYLDKTNAMMSLGYIANRTGSRRAIDYLVKGAYPDTWSKSPLARSSQTHLQLTNQQDVQDVSKYAIFGLILSGEMGKPALTRIAEKQRLTQNKDQTSTNALSSTFIEESLAENEKVSALGLENYGKKEHPQH